MAKEIVYPSQEWLDKWVDNWLDKHPSEAVSDFKALEAQAESAWWDKQIDKGNPTPYDLTAEQKEASKQAMKTAKPKEPKKPSSYSLENKPKRERKPNEEKRELIDLLAQFMTNRDFPNVVVVNPEKTIDFTLGENHYSVTLTCHRAPKNAG